MDTPATHVYHMLYMPSEPDQVVTMVRKIIQHDKIIDPFAIFKKEQCDPNNKCLKIDQMIQEGSMGESVGGPLVQPTHWSLVLRQGPHGQWMTMLSLVPRPLISQYVVCHP